MCLFSLCFILNRMMKTGNKALFLDRDGVLIEDVSYPHKKEDLRIREDIIPHLVRAQKKGFKLIIMTNQSGIARGLFSVEQYEFFQQMVNRELERRKVFIDGVYFCPYLKGGTVAIYDKDSEDRKPGAGMFVRAQADFSLDMVHSFMIGDKFSDIIDYPGLRSLIIKSRYTADKPEMTYNDFDSLFQVIENEI